MNLLIPMAGKSSRFANMRPKWMLTHPSGKFMVVEAIKSLPLDHFDKIYLIMLQEHEDNYSFSKGLKEELDDLNLLIKTEFIFLDNETKDQPETIHKAIQLRNIEGPIFIKDSDNHFKIGDISSNSVCYYDLNESGLIQPSNKSYLTTDEFGYVTNIVEKSVISSSYCVGGYAFDSAIEFSDYLSKLPIDKNRYISDVIFSMILDNHKFGATQVEHYLDWGTIEDWDRFKRSYATLFIDIDGTLIENSSSHFPPYIGNTDGIEPNISIIRHLYETGKFQIILTTARKDKYRKITEEQMKREKIPYDNLIMDLFHSKRIIINDYGKSNPYKSCDSINLKRDSNDLEDILKEALGIDYKEIF